MTNPLISAAEHEKSECKESLLSQLNGKAAQVAAGCHVTEKLVTWLSLQRGTHNLSFEEITAFIKTNPDWPYQGRMRREAEYAIDPNTPSQAVMAWFKAYPPLTTEGVLAYAAELKKHGQADGLKALIKGAWVEKDFSKDQQEYFIKKYGAYLTPADHQNRLERLLWADQKAQAKRLMPLISKDQQQLAEARLTFKEGKKTRVPAKFEKHEGALFDQVHSLRKQKRFDEAAKLIHQAKQSSANAESWWKECHYIAREFIEQKRYEDALQLITGHKLTSGEGFANAEWTSGWLCLRFLNTPTKALQHFQTLYNNVKSPISLARAAYWAGRSYESMKKVTEAAQWYEKAAIHVTTYYGQLAAAKLKRRSYPDLEHVSQASAQHKEALRKDELTQAINLVVSLGKNYYSWTRPLALALAQKAKTKEEKHALLEYIANKVPHEAVWVAKKAGSDKHMVFKHGYPHLKNLPQSPGLPESSLAHAIAYQESRFDPYAVSSAGAMGLMQLMPGTARDAAKKIGVKHEKSKLISDPSHNVLLGSHHLSHILDLYDNSYILAIAAYNAGPDPVNRWLTVFGDPRKGEIDIIDWLELIPYYETRNYVQRVLENLTPYRSLIEGEVKSTIIDDLQR